MEPDDSARQDAQAFIAALDEVDLLRFRVVGTYTRYDESARNALQDARQKILAGFEPPGRKRENHLIWAAPGTGKTYFVQQIAASLGDGVRYHELNLAKCTEAEFRSGLSALDGGQACLCLIDEVDAKPQEPWPYEILLPYLDAAVERGARFVFVLAGSSGSSLEDIKQRIAARPKGTDLLSRIPTGHEHVIGPMSLGDRLLIVLSQLRQAGQERSRDIRAIEKLGLYYVALNPGSRMPASCASLRSGPWNGCPKPTAGSSTITSLCRAIRRTRRSGCRRRRSPNVSSTRLWCWRETASG